MDKILKDLINSNPSDLTGESKNLFEAIMKIADERDNLINKFVSIVNNIETSNKETFSKKEIIQLLKELV